jgi:exodeoxyribonuclease-3
MRIATYNVSDVRKRLEPLRAWLDVTYPEVVCLQEIKCTAVDFPFAALRAMGYEALVYGQKSWNGVAILAKGSKPLEIRRGLPNSPADKEARYLEAAVDGVVVGCLYMPNGNPQPGPKFERKLEWFERFNRHADALLKTGHPVVLAGDYNVVPTDADIYATRSFKDNALLQPGPRAAFQELLQAGWTDALHAQSPAEPIYTFWSYMRNRWARDAGMRIDHLLLSPAAARRMKIAGVDRDVRGLEGASDHAPAWVVLD